jgi:hypothetical protein
MVSSKIGREAEPGQGDGGDGDGSVELRAALHEAAARDGLALEAASDATTFGVAGLLVELGWVSHEVRRRILRPCEG